MAPAPATFSLPVDLGVDEFAAGAVGCPVHHLDRPAVQRGQLREVGIGDEARQRPGARTGHFDLALHQRLQHLKIGEQLRRSRTAWS